MLSEKKKKRKRKIQNQIKKESEKHIYIVMGMKMENLFDSYFDDDYEKGQSCKFFNSHLKKKKIKNFPIDSGQM